MFSGGPGRKGAAPFNHFIRRTELLMTTLKDVADACNVSVSTVSRALNGNSLIRPEVAAAIRETAQNRTGRSLPVYMPVPFRPVTPLSRVAMIWAAMFMPL